MNTTVDYSSWLSALDDDSFDEVLSAAEAMVQVHEALANDNLSLLNELFRDLDDGPIEQWNHYPADDCVDPSTGAMFYYHAHDPADWQRDEHGHFHLFVRAGHGEDFSHFLAVSMTAYGTPNGLFTTNRWVTDETLLPSGELLRRVDEGFEINRARPSWLVNQWLMALVMLVRPQMEALLRDRDQALGWADPTKAVAEAQTEDRERHILSEMSFDLMRVLADVRQEAGRRFAEDAAET